MRVPLEARISTGSTLAWLDYSENERRRMLEAIELFRERDTVDELGLGSARDAFSDLLFPGTSVLHTRARYLLFIPWIYGDLERKTIGSAQIAVAARRSEIALISALSRGGAEERGIIGIQAGERLQRLPSSAYWQGLHRLGIRIFAGSQDRYHRSLDAYYAERRRYWELRRSVQGDDGELGERQPSNWHRDLPDPPDGLLEAASFVLTAQEAGYLRDRILLEAPETLFAELVERRDVPVAGVARPWQHPACASLEPQLRERVEFARLFSDLMHGAQLLYGCLVADLISDDSTSDYRTRLERWETDRGRLIQQAQSVDRQRFWAVARQGNPRVPHPTQRFVDRWWDTVAADATPVTEALSARTLVTERELFLKRGLARLDRANHRARELWGGTAGLNQLDYRWGTVRQLLEDIHLGLGDSA